LTPQRLHTPTSKGEYLGDILKSNEDIVHALWRHRDKREQGSRIGRCGWITSFLKFFAVQKILEYRVKSTENKYNCYL
jgi:hypothetical protein